MTLCLEDLSVKNGKKGVMTHEVRGSVNLVINLMFKGGIKIIGNEYIFLDIHEKTKFKTILSQNVVKIRGLLSR